ncbi:MAG: prepilin-type N-terminal cleavage/methylation domain-containing protein [Candidatus Competibacteraceae bacterium]|nr:prepilin-type N-terminal cleavage/methylation domain-containing protein [Candidatus Competibacteraceae bacterium]
MNDMMIYGSRKRQHGLTLVEIMVALTLGLVLIAGLLQLFVGTRQTYRAQENLSRLQENGRYALEYVNRTLRLSGYRSRETIEEGETFEDKFDVSTNTDQRPIWGADDSTSPDPDPDTVHVSFEGETTLSQINASPPISSLQGDVVDCLGRVAPIDLASRNTLTLAGTDLQCTSIINAVTSTQAIVEGVEDFQVLYGEDTNGNGVANRYVPEGSVSDMNKVVSVRVCLLLRTEEDNVAVEPSTYVDCQGTNPLPTATDRRFRRAFTTTISLRNRLL